MITNSHDVYVVVVGESPGRVRDHRSSESTGSGILHREMGGHC